MRRGPKRKPSILRILEGNRSRTAIPVEPESVDAPFAKPDYLDGLAGETWIRIVSVCPWIRSENLETLNLACIAYEKAVANPSTTNLQTWRVYASELGLTPASRSELGANQTKSPEDEWAGLIA